MLHITDEEIHKQLNEKLKKSKTNIFWNKKKIKKNFWPSIFWYIFQKIMAHFMLPGQRGFSWYHLWNDPIMLPRLNDSYMIIYFDIMEKTTENSFVFVALIDLIFIIIGWSFIY